MHSNRTLRLGTLGLALASASPLALSQACTSSDNPAPSGDDVDASFAVDGAVKSPPGSDASVDSAPPDEDGGSVDGSVVEDTGASDGGGTPDASDAGVKGAIASCAPITPLVDAGAEINLTGGTYQGKGLVTWNVSAATAGDTQAHLRGRWFNGATFGPQIDFGAAFEQAATSVVDGTGKAFVLFQAPTGLGSAIFDVTTGSTVSVTSRPARISDYSTYGEAPLPQGAVVVYNGDGKTELLDGYSNGHWDDDAGVDAGSYPAVNGCYAGAALDKTGKGVVYWTESTSGAGNKLSIAPFDGTRGGTPVTRTFLNPDSGATTALLFTAVALANGDIAFAWETNPAGAAFAIFHPTAAAGQQWDPDETIYVNTAVTSQGGPQLLVDSSGTIMAVYSQGTGSGVALKRRTGTTWSAPIVVGTSSSGPDAILDPQDNVVALVQEYPVGARIARLPKNGTAFGALVTTGLGSSNVTYPILLTPAGDPMVVGAGAATGELATTICTGP